MGRIVRLAALAASLAFAGCGPQYTPEEAAVLTTGKAVNDSLAREHKITWTEATRRNIAEVTRVGGSRITDTDRLDFSYRLALAAEVDAGRMTPELAQFRYDERLAADRAAEQQRRAAAIQAFGNAIQAGAQAATQNQPITCTSNRMGTMTTTTCD